jgi:hypothetical protein
MDEKIMPESRQFPGLELKVGSPGYETGMIINQPRRSAVDK